MAQTVIGMFDNASEAREAVEKLVSKGFSRENIDVSSRNMSSDRSVGSTSSSDVSSDYASGGVTGSSYAGTGSDASSTDFSNDENRINTSSNTYGRDERGSDHKGSAIGNFFRSLFGNDDEADRYSNVADRTGSIVTVHAKSADEAEQAADILDDAGAVDINERASQYGYNRNSSSDTDFGSTRSGTSNETSATGSIPVIEEQLQVGKKMVETGGKRLRSRIVERPVEESLRLREERVWVERNAVDRPATEADLANFQQKEVELVERAEVPVVAKEARVIEEVSLGKEVDERVETIRDTVRNTEVEVEDIEKNDVRRSSTGTSFNSSDDLSTK